MQGHMLAFSLGELHSYRGREKSDMTNIRKEKKMTETDEYES